MSFLLLSRKMSLSGGDLMKKPGLIALFTITLAGLAFGQGLLETDKIA